MQMMHGFEMDFLCIQHDYLSGLQQWILNTFCLQTSIDKFQSGENGGRHSEREHYGHHTCLSFCLDSGWKSTWQSQGCTGSSEGKSTHWISWRSWVWMPSTSIKVGIDSCVTPPAMGGRDKRILEVLWLPSFWFSERLFQDTNAERMEEDIQCFPLAPHVYMHTCTLMCMYHTHSYACTLTWMCHTLICMHHAHSHACTTHNHMYATCTYACTIYTHTHAPHALTCMYHVYLRIAHILTCMYHIHLHAYTIHTNMHTPLICMHHAYSHVCITHSHACTMHTRMHVPCIHVCTTHTHMHVPHTHMHVPNTLTCIYHTH